MPHAAPPGTFSSLSVSSDIAYASGPSGAVYWLLWNETILPLPPKILDNVVLGVNGPCGLDPQTRVGSCWSGYDQVKFPAEPLKKLAVGTSWVCAIRDDGTLGCWGYGSEVQLKFPSGTFTDISAFDGSVCAMDALGTLTCWGDFGDGTACCQDKTFQPKGEFSQFCVGQDFGCGIMKSGSISCWGFNDRGQASPPQP